MGDEFILNLAASLKGFDKTAAKDDDKDDKNDKKDKEDKKKKDEEDKKKKDEEDKKKKDEDKKKKDKKDDKKASVMEVINGLSKLAGVLDEMGADDASDAVDDALRIIVKNLRKEQD